MISSTSPTLSACLPGEAPPSLTCLAPAAAFAWRTALSMPSETKVIDEGPLGTVSSGGGLCVRMNTGASFTGCRPFQPCVMSYVHRPKMKAPDSSNMRRTSSRFGPGSGLNSGSRNSVEPEKYQLKIFIRHVYRVDQPAHHEVRRRIHRATWSCR